jgi:asparagine synthase (glutamine-hydrolysing)
MCGISGFIDSSKSLSTSTLENMSKVISYRGPDGNGNILIKNKFANVAMAHNRLSILDLSTAGKQPMEFKGSFICFNGEIYNFREIKSELINCGYNFETSTDTEVILKAFDKWGTKCVDRFIGMFVFVIYKGNKVYFCRDRAGVKPLYYFLKDSVLLFASELKALIECEIFSKELNSDGLISYLKYGYISNSNCIYENTFKLIPGSWLIFDLEKFECKLEEYWKIDEFYESEKTNLNYFEIKENTKKILLDSFNLRMISDVPVGIFLSGGYDSNCLTSMLQSTKNFNLETFSVGFENYRYNETSISKQTSEYIGTNHNEIFCSKSDIISSYNKISYFYDEPFSDISSIPSMIICEVAKSRGVSVALSADGGDEIFGGYNKYIEAIRLNEKILGFNSFSKEISSIVLKINEAIINRIGSFDIKQNLYLLNKRIKLLNIKQPEKLLDEISLVFTDADINELLIDHGSQYNLVSEFDSPNRISDFLDKILCVDYKTYMRDNILTKMDRAGMSSSLEVREPFLDHRIIEWVATIPSKFKISDNLTSKYLLKDITHDFLPQNLLNNKKQGFSFPVLDYLNDTINIEVSNYLNTDFIIKQKIFNPHYIEFLVSRYKSNPSKYFKKIWVLINFQSWYNKWF